MKRNKYIGYAMMAAGLFAASSCTDFADYNEVPVDERANANQTLWENISQNPNLSDFMALVERTGFHQQLSQPKAYTIWAPRNGSFTVSDYSSLSDSLLLAQFVKNHIAEYTYRASGNVDKTNIHMLNNKSYVFNGNGTYTFGKAEMDPAAMNIPGTNGILHVIDRANTFYPNLYEFLPLSKGMEVDSIVNYILSYEKTELDLSKSEKGPMVNGMQTYVDSVMRTSNSMVNWMNARMSDEDSSYTFVIPTNAAYKKMYDKVKGYLNFVSAIPVQDVEKLTSAGKTDVSGDKARNAISKTTPAINVNYWKDSLTRRNILRHLMFSNTSSYNEFIIQRDAQAGDSIYSTKADQYSIDRLNRVTNKLGLFSNPKEILNDHLVGSPKELSNGYVRIVDSLAIHPWESYCPELVFTPSEHLGNLFTAKKSTIRMINSESLATELLGPGNTEFRYTLIEASEQRKKPDVFLKLPEVQSTKYNVYCVVLPANCGREYAQSTLLNDSIPVTNSQSYNAPDSLFKETVMGNKFTFYFLHGEGETPTYNVSYRTSQGGALNELNINVKELKFGARVEYTAESQDIATAISKFGLVFSGGDYKVGYILKDNARPTPMNFDLSYSTAKAALTNYHFSAKFQKSRAKADENPGTLDLNTAFMNDPHKIDTLLLGQVEIPVNYKYLGDDYYPSMHISSPVAVFNATQMAQYSREFRIYAIIMRPVELDQYEANNQ